MKQISQILLLLALLTACFDVFASVHLHSKPSSQSDSQAGIQTAEMRASHFNLDLHNPSDEAPCSPLDCAAGHCHSNHISILAFELHNAFSPVAIDPDSFVVADSVLPRSPFLGTLKRPPRA